MFIEIEYFPCSLNQILTKYQAVHYRDENGLHGFLVGNEVEIFKLHCDSTTSRFCVDTIFKSAVTNQPYCQITSFTVLPKVGIYPECLVVCLRNNETQLLEEGDATRDILFFELRSLIYPPNSDKSLSTLPLQILKLQSIPVSINCITLGLGNYERLNALVIFNGNHSAKIFTPNRKDSGKFAEVDYKECEMLFPDLIMKPFTSTALSFHYISWLGNVNHGRITGCADGSIRLAWSPETGLTVWESIILDGPITGVQVLDTDNAEVMDVIACTVLGTVAYIRLSNSGEISFASEQINDLEIGDALMCISLLAERENLILVEALTSLREHILADLFVLNLVYILTCKQFLG